MSKIWKWFLDKRIRMLNLILGFFILFIVTAYYIHIKCSSTTRIDEVFSISTDMDPDSLYRFSLPDTLPHRVYQHKMDSINSCSNSLLRNHLLAAGTQEEMGGVSVGKYYECDTCDYSKYRDLYKPDKRETTKYYLKLNDLELIQLDPRFANDDFVPPFFFTNLGFTNMKYLHVDKAVNGNRWTPAHYTVKKLKYKVVDMFNATDNAQKKILIPVSKTYFQIFNELSYIILISVALIFLKVLGGVIVFLFDIAKGNAFSISNYKRLFSLAYIIALIPLINIVPKVIFHWIYSSYYKNEFTIYIDWGENIKWIFVSLLILILAKAFKKGFLIQQEQNLTV
jgi:hypothetical protein